MGNGSGNSERSRCYIIASGNLVRAEGAITLFVKGRAGQVQKTLEIMDKIKGAVTPEVPLYD